VIVSAAESRGLQADAAASKPPLRHLLAPGSCARRALVAVLLVFGAALAASPAQAEGGALESEQVLLANQHVVTLRGPIAGYTARERVDNVQKRLDAALDKQALPPVSLDEVPEGSRVLVGGELAFVVTRADIDPTFGETTSVVAQVSAKRLEHAIAELRKQQTPGYRAWAAGFALAATVLFALGAVLLVRAKRWLSDRLSGAATRHGQRLTVEGVELLESGRLARFTHFLVRAFAWLIAAAGSAVWLAFVLSQFPATRSWGDGLLTSLVELLAQLARAAVGALPGVFVVVLIVLIARTVIHMSALLFERVETGDLHVSWIDQETARPTRRLFSVVVWGFALAMAYPYLPGSGSEAFKGLSVLVGVMVSLGGSSVIGRAAAGLTLMYSRAFRRGDYVRIGDTEGTVEEVGMFMTQLRTGLGEALSIPNSTVVSEVTRNYSRAAPGTAFLVDTSVTIGYSTPWRQVEAMLLDASRRTHALAATPAPFVRQTSLGDFYVEYRLAAFAPPERLGQRLKILNELHANIQDVFNEYGVQIMSPHYEADPQHPQVVAKQDWYAPPARAAVNGGNEALPPESQRRQAREQ
jgi:small-conductance mechanosensitive channel